MKHEMDEAQRQKLMAAWEKPVDSNGNKIEVLPAGTAAFVQAMPVKNADSQDVLQDLLCQEDYTGKKLINESLAAQLQARVELGVRKYGTRLETNNGRDVILDIRQELLDGIMYSHQGVMQGVRCAFVRDQLIKILADLDQLERAKW